MRRAALRDAVAARIADGGVRVVERVDAADGKTKTLVTGLAALGVAAAPTIVVVTALGDALLRAARNVPWLTVETPAHVSVYQLLRARQAVFERAALLALEEALAP
jgi:large subunit ribosomal protein L4